MEDQAVSTEEQPDFPTRLRAFRKLTGMSNAEIARRIEAPVDLVRSWQRGRIPRGMALLNLMVLASRIPDGMDTMFPVIAADLRALDARREKLHGGA